MRTLATAAAAVVLSLATACGGGSETEPVAQDAQSATPTTAAQATASPEATASPDATTTPGATGSPDATASPEGDGAGQTLVGRVGEEGDPNAFVITLMDQSGQEVTSLPAGEYEIQVEDPSVIHNFHLTGPGGLDESTTVLGTTETTWQVTLEEGEYTYVCDPHSQTMNGQFTVTA